MAQEFPGNTGGGGASAPAPAPSSGPSSSNTRPDTTPRRYIVGDKIKGPVSDREATFVDGLKTVRLGDIYNVLQASCAPRSFMNGIIVGVAAGGASLMIVRTSISRACNVTVGSWLIGSIGTHEWCQWNRRREKAKLKRTVEAYQAAKAAQAAGAKPKVNEHARPKRLEGELPGGGSKATRVDEEPKPRRSGWRFW